MVYNLPLVMTHCYLIKWSNPRDAALNVSVHATPSIDKAWLQGKSEKWDISALHKWDITELVLQIVSNPVTDGSRSAK